MDLYGYSPMKRGYTLGVKDFPNQILFDCGGLKELRVV